jgi:hypothetical protein
MHWQGKGVRGDIMVVWVCVFSMEGAITLKVQNIILSGLFNTLMGWYF